MHISKLDAALRQLEVAIRMFFEYGDEIAIHTLAGAAQSVLRDLVRHQGKEAQLDAKVREKFVPERHLEARAILVEAQNFFKHADRDADELLDFEPRTTHFILLDACTSYGVLTSHPVPLLTLFDVWFAAANPDLATPISGEVAEMASVIGPLDREAFVNELLPMAQRLVGRPSRGR